MGSANGAEGWNAGWNGAEMEPAGCERPGGTGWLPVMALGVGALGCRESGANGIVCP